MFSSGHLVADMIMMTTKISYFKEHVLPINKILVSKNIYQEMKRKKRYSGSVSLLPSVGIKKSEQLVRFYIQYISQS